MADSFLTVEEVAGLLRLNQQTVRNMIDRRDLRAVRLGRRVRIRQSDLDAFIAAGATAPIEESLASLDRAELAACLDRARNALEVGDDIELAAALRALAELPQTGVDDQGSADV